MSIITEALKKAELEANQKRNNAFETLLPGISIPIQKKKRIKIPKNTILQLSFIIAIILIGFLSLYLFKTFSKLNTVKSSVNVKKEPFVNVEIKNSKTKKNGYYKKSL